ncbi:MAG TPA: ATP-grasp fold amidoligase family protein [Arachnia sp.]|nr:ATP-grasp fold amidoligase family protein [Arachnia sp.]HMT85145.1 ATP-grasp fold amidoligase family protein [Arachnia sp.]
MKLLYWVNLGTIPNLDQPVTFNEKLQWLKLHDRDPHYTTLVDKLAVKSWVTEQIGEDRVIPLLGAWDSFDDIDFNDLPAQFVLKCTHDSGGLVICQDIKNFDHEGARNIIEHSLSSNYFSLGREWPYRDVKPRVLAEVYFPGWRPDSHVAEREDTALDPGAGSTPTPPGSTEGVIDYKFYCFHGEPEFLYVSQGLHDHRTAKMVFLNPDWTPAGFRRLDYRDFDPLPPKPRRLEQMITIARQLSKNIPFVRVDLFEHEGHVLFSEMTFTPVSGMMPFDPPDADRAIGQLLDLSRVEKRR